MPAREQVSQQRTDAEGNADRLVGMALHHLIGGSCALNGFLVDALVNIAAPIQSVSQTPPCFDDLLLGDFSGGGQERTRVVSQTFQRAFHGVRSFTISFHNDVFLP